MRVVVLVLGELGRSPRMLAHAGSLLDAGHDVHLVGATATALPRRLQAAGSLRVHAVDPGRSTSGSGALAALATAWRGVRLTWRLGRVLLHELPSFDVMLVQTPPSLPTLPLALLAARLRGARLIVDWHNLGWPLLGLRFGAHHPLVRALRRVELACGRACRVHLAVTSVLARRLGDCGITGARVLHDAPSAVRPFGPPRDDLPPEPLVVVAPMGWSRDDDLALLEDALRYLREQTAAKAGKSIVLRVSGNGPLRAAWVPRLMQLCNDRISVETPDVSTDAYPALLASAHLGLSVHRSASGADAPMKVVELLASGVPVLALDDGGPLEEIAPRGCGVRRYATARELGDTLASLLDAGDGDRLLAELRQEARAQPQPAWEVEWQRVVAPLLSAPQPGTEHLMATAGHV